MKHHRLKPFIVIVCLIVATGAAMAYSSNFGKSFFTHWFTSSRNSTQINSGPVVISGYLVQNKILQGSDGKVNLALSLRADDVFESSTEVPRNVDMVIVLDRSGSMKGRKIEDARQAVLKLLANLTSKDRFALITYSDGVQYVTHLQSVTRNNRKQAEHLICKVRAGGGTNLGAGLQAGINVLSNTKASGNSAKLVLISDGLANKGITNPQALGTMSSIAVEEEFAVSTVGVGSDFNEQLMTTIADQGAGNYYYLENPAAFAEIFQKEFLYTKATVASNVAVYFPMANDITLVNAAGYPTKIQNNHFIFYPGDLRSGQTRKLFLTLHVPSAKAGKIEIGKIRVNYLFKGQSFETAIGESFTIACVKNQKEVVSSIDKAAWAEKVIQEDYNRLKQEVAADIKSGKKEKALQRIDNYYREQEEVNASVGSEVITNNLNRDLTELKQVVKDTFQGAPAAVYRKQKTNAKALQYEGYSGRRQN
jgi:Ca-activated chloride channel family protein